MAPSPIATVTVDDPLTLISMALDITNGNEEADPDTGSTDLNSDKDDAPPSEGHFG